MSTTFAPGAARRVRATARPLTLTHDAATDGRRHTPKPQPRRQATRRQAVLAAMREER